MRSTTQRPAGGVQSSVPSARIFEVRSITSALRHRCPRRHRGRGQRIDVGRRGEGGLLFEAVDRCPVCSTSSAIWVRPAAPEPRAAPPRAGRIPPKPPRSGRPAWLRQERERKNRAVTAGRTRWCARPGRVSPPRSGTAGRRRSLPVPARCVRGAATAASAAATPAVTSVSRGRSAAAANSNWIQAFSLYRRAGSSVAFARSPSVSAATSNVPPLEVTFGCKSAIGTSPSGAR